MSGRFGNGSNSNGQFWYGSTTNFPGFLYKKNVGVGGRRTTKFAAGGNITCNKSTYLYNKYKPGTGGVGASSIANRRAKNRLATVCGPQNCFTCYKTLGQYNKYLYNPNGFYPCINNGININNSNNANNRNNNPTQSNKSFLVYQQGIRGPGDGIYGVNFGWDSVVNGIWFSGPANKQNETSSPSYPIFTNFSIPSNVPVDITFTYQRTGDVQHAGDYGFGIAFYAENEMPKWCYSYDNSRIAVQNQYGYNYVYGQTVSDTKYTSDLETPLSINETYTIVVSYAPEQNSANANINVEVYDSGGTYKQEYSLNGNLQKINGNYKIGFCADQNITGAKTYINNIVIDINNGTQYYQNLQKIDPV
jgi:hypothetical protein